jgi:lipid-binding SYLF domain-containing protein
MKGKATSSIFSRIIVRAMIFGAVLASAFVGSARGSDSAEAEATMDRAKATFTSFMADDNYTWLHEHLPTAKGVLIYPQVFKAGFFLGGSGGTGVLMVQDAKNHEWHGPSFYTVGSVTFGLQIGAESSEVMVLVMSQKGIDSLLSSSLSLGGSVSLAIGPVGAGAKGEFPADLIAFSRTKGLYGGLNLEGSLIKVRDSLNRAYYGKEVSPVDILVRKSQTNQGAAGLLEALQKASKKF